MAGGSFQPFNPNDPQGLFNVQQSVSRSEALLDKMRGSYEAGSATMHGAFSVARGDMRSAGSLMSAIQAPAMIAGNVSAGMHMRMQALRTPMVGLSPIQSLGAAAGLPVTFEQFRGGEVNTHVREVMASNVRAGIQDTALQALRTGPGSMARMAGFMSGTPLGMIAGVAGGALADTVVPQVLRATGLEFELQREQINQRVHGSLVGRMVGNNLMGGSLLPSMEKSRGIVNTLEDEMKRFQGGAFGIEAKQFGALAGATLDIESTPQLNKMVTDNKRLRENFRAMREAALDLNLSFEELGNVVRELGPLEGGAQTMGQLASRARSVAASTGLSRMSFIRAFGEGRDIGRQVGISGNLAGQSLAEMAGTVRGQFQNNQLSLDQLFRFGGKDENEAALNFARTMMQANVGAMQSPLGKMQLINAFSSGRPNAGGGFLGQMTTAGANLAANPFASLDASMSERAISQTGPAAFVRNFATMMDSPMASITGGGVQGRRRIAGIIGQQMGMSGIQSNALFSVIENQRKGITDRGIVGGDSVMERIAFEQSNPELMAAAASAAKGSGISAQQMMDEVFASSGGNLDAARAQLVMRSNSVTSQLTGADRDRRLGVLTNSLDTIVKDIDLAGTSTAGGFAREVGNTMLGFVGLDRKVGSRGITRMGDVIESKFDVGFEINQKNFAALLDDASKEEGEDIVSEIRNNFFRNKHRGVFGVDAAGNLSRVEDITGTGDLKKFTRFFTAGLTSDGLYDPTQQHGTIEDITGNITSIASRRMTDAVMQENMMMKNFGNIFGGTGLTKGLDIDASNLANILIGADTGDQSARSIAGRLRGGGLGDRASNQVIDKLAEGLSSQFKFGRTTDANDNDILSLEFQDDTALNQFLSGGAFRPETFGLSKDISVDEVRQKAQNDKTLSTKLAFGALSHFAGTEISPILNDSKNRMQDMIQTNTFNMHQELKALHTTIKDKGGP